MQAMVWFQSADLTNHEPEMMTVDQAIHAFKTYDWAQEAALLEQLESAGEPCVPAGIKIGRDADGLHVCPMGGAKNVVFFDYSMPTRTFFGLLSSTKHKSDVARDLSDETCLELIRLFYDGDYETIAQRMEGW